MSTYAYASYPAPGVNSGINNVLHSVTKYVLGKFPHRVIKAFFVDTRGNMRDLYHNLYTSADINSIKAASTNVQEIRKIKRPHLYVGYSYDGFNTADSGLGEFPLFYYPNAYFFQTSLNSVFPILRDNKRKIFIGTYNLRIRITAEFIFSCQNKEEQTTIYIYLKNFIKEKYGYNIDGIKTKYIFPSAVIQSLKNMLYGKSVPFKDITEDLILYLKKYSNEAVKPVWRDGKEDALFFEMGYTYRAVRFQLSGAIQLDDGDKKDMAYDNYTIRFPAIVEFYIPINYVLRSAELIPSAAGSPNIIDDNLLIDAVPDEDNNVQLLEIIKQYNDDASRCYIDLPYMNLIARDEFALEDSEDYYDLQAALPKDYAVLFNFLSSEEKKKSHRVLLYEDNRILDENKYVNINWSNSIANIHKGDINKIQMIEIYANLDLVKSFIKNRILKKEHAHG
jgi:hypothetical protein